MLPEDEWIIGISNLEYFNGVGYSMPIGVRLDGAIPSQSGLLTGGRLTADLPQSSNIDDAVRFFENENGQQDPLFEQTYIHQEDALQASGGESEEGPVPETEEIDFLVMKMGEDFEPKNLYAFLPGIFYCSSQQTSVDAIVIEVTQQQKFGMTLSSFKPEDVRPLDLTQGMMLDEKGFGKSIQLSVDTLGSFHAESFLKDSGISTEELQYCREIELANQMAQWLTLPVLKQAYAASSFLQTRLTKLLDDIEFFGLLPRRRIYVRNERYPFGSIIETKYQGLDTILTLGDETGIACPDSVDLELELKTLTFSKMLGIGTETDIEAAIVDLFLLINQGLGGEISKDEVLKKFTGRPSF